MRAIRLPEIIAVIIIVLLTHLLQSLFTLPRMMVEVTLMNLPWDGIGDPMRFYPEVFDVLDFIFALFAGALSMSGCRFIVPAADTALVFIIATTFALVFALGFALAEAIWPLNIAGMFVPPSFDAAYALPGWLIGYYFRMSADGRAALDIRLSGAIAAAAILMAIGLPFLPARQVPAINQSYMPHVNETFQPVPEAQAPLPSSDGMPDFAPVPPAAQQPNTPPQ